MVNAIKCLLVTLVFSSLFGIEAQANTIPAASCNASDVQTAINSAANGDTVTVPAGTCIWTGSPTISITKAIKLRGAGSGRIIAISDGTTTVSIGNGTKTFNIANFSPGFSGTNFSGTLKIFENGTNTNFMTGTVVSYSGGVLTMNITSSGGSCRSNALSNCKRWLVSTPSQTVIQNNSSANDLINVSESTAGSVDISGIKFGNFKNDTGGAQEINVFYTSGGKPVLLHDCWVQYNANVPSTPSGNETPIYWNTNRGVIWNCSFDSSPFSNDNGGVGGVFGNQSGAISQQDIQNFLGSSWTTPSNFGTADTTGTANLYVETNDFHGFSFASSTEENARQVFRHNLNDNGGALGTHGVDTGILGRRYIEAYNNTFNFNGYSDGTTAQMNWWVYLRGGGLVFHDNEVPTLQSTDYGTKSDIGMIVMTLQRNAGAIPCWGAGTSNGTDHFAPRQVGYGYVTGSGVDGKGSSTYDGSGHGYPSNLYVGDSEPVYIWNNVVGGVVTNPLPQVNVQDYGSGNTNSCTGSTDSSVNYIKLNRDYFNGTAKPGYTPYTYPHPLTHGSGSSGSGSNVNAPTGLSATVQ